MEGSHESRIVGSFLEAEKDTEIDAPLEPPEGMLPCQRLAFSPIRPISDFLTSRTVR